MKNKSFIFDIIFIIVATTILIIINEFKLIEDTGNYSVIIAIISYVIGKTIVVRYYNKKDKNNCEVN